MVISVRNHTRGNVTSGTSCCPAWTITVALERLDHLLMQDTQPKEWNVSLGMQVGLKWPRGWCTVSWISSLLATKLMFSPLPLSYPREMRETYFSMRDTYTSSWVYDQSVHWKLPGGWYSLLLSSLHASSSNITTCSGNWKTSFEISWILKCSQLNRKYTLT